jgi:hypothetical protein
MTLDEMIAWLADEACAELEEADTWRLRGACGHQDACRERAATLLTIENALRDYRQMQEDEEQRYMDARGDALDRGL